MSKRLDPLITPIFYINNLLEHDNPDNFNDINTIGVIIDVSERPVTNGSLWIVKFEDRSGRMEVALWEDKYKIYETFLKQGNIVQIIGNIGETKYGTKRLYVKMMHSVKEHEEDNEQ